MKNVKLGSKLIGSYIIIALITAVVGVIGIIGVNQIEKADTDLVERNLIPTVQFSQAETVFTNMRSQMRDLLIKSELEELKATADLTKKSRADIEDRLAKFEKTIRSKEMREQYDKLKAAMANYYALCDEVTQLSLLGNKAEAMQAAFGKGAPIAREAAVAFGKMMEMRIQDAHTGSESNTSLARALTLVMISVTVIGFILAAVLGILLTRSIMNPLNRVIAGLGEASDQVASASSQVSTASQQLAEGTSEQAASLEESSSSLEELSSMTKQNAQNATEAKGMMKEAGTIVSNVGRLMDNMAHSMVEITRSSEETGKIIKTIDEIAFQTNLLALNAAVEAARAGEAGAGFAVVADEVRNLAMRAAESAKSTNNLIDGTIKVVREGADLTKQTQDAFKQNQEIAGKIATLVDEIESASHEQARGIEQINIAVSEMDKVTQQAAANAEESASASEEMNAQAEQMQQFVIELRGVVGGSNGQNGHSVRMRPSGVPSTGEKIRTVLPAPLKGIGSTSRSRVVKPEQVIPMEDSFTSL